MEGNGATSRTHRPAAGPRSLASAAVRAGSCSLLGLACVSQDVHQHPGPYPQDASVPSPSRCDKHECLQMLDAPWAGRTALAEDPCPTGLMMEGREHLLFSRTETGTVHGVRSHSHRGDIGS